MSSIWEGLPSGERKPIFSLPYLVKTVLSLPSQLVLLTEDGKINLWRSGEVSALETEPELEPVISIRLETGQAQTDEVTKDKDEKQDLEQESKLLCLVETGFVYRVSLSSLSVEQVEYPGDRLLTLVGDEKHEFFSDTTGHVWSRGSVPYSGLVHQTELFEKVPFFSGKKLLQVETGTDFSICLVKSDDSLLSPDIGEPNTSLSEPDGPSCPLGLSLNLSLNTDYNRNITEPKKPATRERLRSAVLTEVPILDRSSESDAINISELSESSFDSSIMHPLSENQVQNLGFPTHLSEVVLEEKAHSEPPSERNSVLLSQPTLEDFIILNESFSKTMPFNKTSLRRSTSNYGIGSDRTLSLQEPSLTDLSTKGKELRRSEVWVWGNGSRGQLGQGDMLSRPSPVVIPSLIPHHILKVSAGSQHALALMASGLVFAWGNNNRGQSNPLDSFAVVLYPAKLQLPKGETVRDILAENNMSMMVCDSGNIYYTKPGSSSNSRLHCIELASLSLPPDTQPYSLLTSDRYSVLNCKPMSKYTCQLVSREKVLLDQIECVSNVLSTLYPTTPNSKNQSNRTPLFDVMKSVHKAKNFLSFCVNRSLTHLSLNEYCFTGLYKYLDPWRESCREICWTVGNCVSSDSLLLDSHQSQHQHIIVDILISKFNIHQKSIKGQLELEQLLVELHKLSENYIKGLMELHTKIKDGKEVMKKIEGFMGLQQSLLKMRQEAEDTREFWKTSGVKLEEFRTPSRRLVLDNRTQPLLLSGVMSKHWLVLLTDIFVDVGYSVTVHPLSTVWLDTPPVTGSGNKFEIVLIMPEETKTLVAVSSQSRALWVKGFLQAIAGTVRNSTSSSLPPVTRSVKYEFTKGEYKGAVYTGSMTQAKLHGKGSFKSPEGSSYNGDWSNGIQHGVGTLTLADGSIKEGTWRQGKLTGNGRLKLADGSVYEGSLVDGLPHGHGVRKEGKFMGRGASVYIGEWEKGLRHGYGVLDDIMTGEKYMGMWAGGARNGKGCVVNSDGIYYEGNFLSNKLSGDGTMIFEDGAVYEGEFYGAGQFNGKGVLTTKNDRFEGLFHGNYSDGMKFNGTVYKNQEPRTPMIGQNWGKLQVNTVNSGRKWGSIFSKFETMLGSENPWEQVAILVNQGKVKAREVGTSCIQDLDYLETIPDFGQKLELNWTEYTEILKYLTIAGTCDFHPFCQIVLKLVQCFNMSYGGVRSHPTLLPHAKDELESISKRLYGSVRKLFPSLPSLDSHAWILTPDLENEAMMITSNSLLFPLLLPSIYPTLFHLYIQREEKRDKEYWARILRWNKHSDTALLTFLDVDISYWDLPADRRSRDELFLEAVDSLQQIKMTFTPKDKLEVILAMFKAITEQSGTANHTWSMDSLLPVCMYVVVRARVLQLGAELAMLSDFMENYLFQGK